jgi:hypothetical protein
MTADGTPIYTSAGRTVYEGNQVLETYFQITQVVSQPLLVTKTGV